MARYFLLLCLFPLLGLLVGCGNEGERGMNKDKGFPRSESPQVKKEAAKK